MIDFASATGRPAGDILSRVVRVTLGGKTYELPVRSIKANREWKANLNAGTMGLVASLDVAGDAVDQVLAALDGQIEPLIDALVAYAPDILPTRDEIEALEPDASNEVVAAVQEVWRAASPLVVSTIRAMAEMAAPMTNGSSTLSSTSPTPTAGSRRKSKST